MRVRTFDICFLVSVLSGFLSVSILPLQAESESFSIPKHPSHQSDPTYTLVKKMYTSYLSLYPEARKLRERFKAGVEPSKTEKQFQQFQSKALDSVEALRRTASSLPSTSSDYAFSVEEVKSVLDVYVRYLKAYISSLPDGWSPDDPERYRKLSRRARLRAGMAAPETLRQKFLSDLFFLLKTIDRGPTTRVYDRIQKHLFTLHRKIFKNLLGVLEALQERSEIDAPDEIEKRKQLKREAKSQWERAETMLNNKQASWLNTLNTSLWLFRDRSLTQYESSLRDRGVKLKQQMAHVRETYQRIDVFVSKQERALLLRRMAVLYLSDVLPRLQSGLDHFSSTYFMYNIALSKVRSHLKKQTVRQSTMERLESYTKRLQPPHRYRGAEINWYQRFEQIPGSIAERMQHLLTLSEYGQTNNKVNRLVSDVIQFGEDLRTFASDSRDLITGTRDVFADYRQNPGNHEEFERELRELLEPRRSELEKTRRSLQKRRKRITERVKEQKNVFSNSSTSNKE